MHLSGVCPSEVTGVEVVRVPGFQPSQVTTVPFPLLCTLRATAAPAGQE